MNNDFNMNFNNNNNSPDPTQIKKKIQKFKRPVLILFGAILGLIIIFNWFTFRVDEREQAVVKQFNEAVKLIVDEDTPETKKARESNEKINKIKVVVGRKGLFFKIPFIQEVDTYTNMLLTYDTAPREVTTRDKKKLVLDNYAQWEIIDSALFISTVENKSQARQRLDEIVYSKLNEEIGKVDAHVVISDKEYVNNMLKRITDYTNKQVTNYGMHVADIRISKTNLPPENYENVFNRMRTERQRAAMKYRSEGKEEAQVIRSEAEQKATIIEAQAYEKAEKIKGEGDAQALKIYADAYNEDPEFYAFWKTLQTYKATIDGQTSIVIDSDSVFAKYLYGPELTIDNDNKNDKEKNND